MGFCLPARRPDASASALRQVPLKPLQVHWHSRSAHYLLDGEGRGGASAARAACALPLRPWLAGQLQLRPAPACTRLQIHKRCSTAPFILHPGRHQLPSGDASGCASGQRRRCRHARALLRRALLLVCRVRGAAASAGQGRAWQACRALGVTGGTTAAPWQRCHWRSSHAGCLVVALMKPHTAPPAPAPTHLQFNTDPYSKGAEWYDVVLSSVPGTAGAQVRLWPPGAGCWARHAGGEAAGARPLSRAHPCRLASHRCRQNARHLPDA